MVTVLLCMSGSPRVTITRTVGYAFALLVILASVGLRIWFDKEHARWFDPQPVSAVVGLVIGFLLLSWQLDRQHQNALDANRRQAQDRLRLDLYDKIAERIESASASQVEVGGLPTAFMGELIVRLSVWSNNQQEIPRSTYFPHLLEKQATASQSVLALMSALETYAIVMPEFSIFRGRLGDALRVLSTAIGDFHQAALPFAGSANASPIKWPPSGADKTILDGLAASVMRASVEVAAVVSDLRVEAQNYLLGDLFGRKVPRRVPSDPAMTVTRIAPTSKSD